jgi:hypothetical protein
MESEIELLLSKYYFLSQGAIYMYFKHGIITASEFLKWCEKELKERGVLL